MSELQELAWSVQEAVEPLPFELLERRGVRRRRRRHVLTGAGVVAAVAIAVLAVLLPAGTQNKLDRPPVATAPNASEVINASDATLEGFAATAGNFWASAWSSCAPAPCRYAARVNIAGLTADSPIGDRPISVLPVGDEAVALLAPKTSPLSAADPTWKQSFILQLSAAGRQLRTLHYADPTSTFYDTEILGHFTSTDELTVLNPFTATLRTLKLPADLGTARLPGHARYLAGRWWLVADIPNGGSQVVWTEDGGRSWHRHPLAGSRPSDTVRTVVPSPDGRVIVAMTSGGDGSATTMERSMDAGRNWQRITGLPPRVSGAAMPFETGDTFLIGQRAGDPTAATYRIAPDGPVTKGGKAPAIGSLGGYGYYLYGVDSTKSVALSKDWGTTWEHLEPR